MHNNPTVLATESTAEFGLSHFSCAAKEADSFSLICAEGNVMPLYKSRICDEQCVTSEASNCLTANSRHDSYSSSHHDSYSENADSKVIVKTAVTCETPEDVDMPSFVLSRETVEGHLPQHKGIALGDFLFSSNIRVTSDLCQMVSGLERHEDKISYIARIKDSNIEAGDCNMLAQKNAASASAHSLLSREVEGTSHYEAAGCLHHSENKEIPSNCERGIKSPQESFQNSAYSADASFSSKSTFTEDSSSKNHSSRSASKGDYVTCHNTDFKDSEGTVCQLHIHGKSSLGQVEVASIVDVNDPTFDHKNYKAGYAGYSFSVDAVKITGSCLENVNDLVKISSNEVMNSSTKNEETEMHSSLVEASNVQEPQQAMNTGDSESEAELTDVKVCDICGDNGREELLSFCSRCSDGAEHTYCMRVMLRKLPEGDWLCEECQLKEDAERLKADPEKISRAEKESKLKENGEVKKVDEKVFAAAKKLKLKEYAEVRKGDRSEVDQVVRGISKECKQGSENLKVHTSESAPRTSKLTCLNETSQNIVTSSNLKPKLDMKDVDPDMRRLPRGLQSPRISARRHAESQEVISLNSKRPPEKIIECIELGSQRKKPALSHENSFKNLNGVKEKVSNLPALNRNQGASSSIGFCHSQSNLGSHSSKFSAQHDPHHGGLSRSSSFSNLNSKPKVKQLVDNVPVKPKISRAPSFNETRKEALFRSMNKPASIKNVKSGGSNAEAASKTQFIHQTRVEDRKSSKQVKERNTIEKKRSAVLDSSPTDLSPRIGTGIFLSMMDVKTSPRDLKSNDMFESNILRMHKGSDDADALGRTEAKKQSKHSSKILGSARLNAIVNEDQSPCQMPKEDEHRSSNYLACLNPKVNEDQSPCQTPKEDERISSNSMDKLCDNAEIVKRQGVFHTIVSAGQDDKTKDPSTFSNYRHSVSGESLNLRCQKCNETSHATQFCSTEKLFSSISTPSIEKNSKDGNKKVNKWKAAVETSISRSRLYNIIRKGAESEDSPISITNQSCEVDSKNFRISSSDHPRNITPLSVEASCASGAIQTIDSSCPLEGNVSNCTYAVSDELHMKHLLHVLRDQASALANPCRTSASPELESIWKGKLEVLGNGNETASFDGIQAHLSTCASPKVLEVATKIPCKVQLEQVSCISSWPLQSLGISPNEHNIALFFFAKDVDSYERSYSKLLEKMLKSNLALRGIIDGVELLIFPSTKLPLHSQRWNRLFFLWGIFKGRRKISLASKLIPQKGPFGPFLNKDPATLYLPCDLSSSVSSSEKVVSVENPEKSPSCGISPKAEALKSKSTTFEGLDKMQRDQESPLVHNFTFQSAAYNRPVSNQGLNSSPTLISRNQLSNVLSNHPESKLKANNIWCCSNVENDEYCERNFGCDFEDKHVATLLAQCPAAYAPTTNEQIGLSRSSPLHLTSSDYSKGTDKESSGSENVSGGEEVLTKSIAAVCDEPRVNLTGAGHLSLGERPNRKRSHSSSTDPLSLASCKITRNTDETMLSKIEVTYSPIGLPINDEREQKRMCRSEEILSMRSLSKVHPLLPSLNEQPTESTDGDISKLIPDNSRKAEKFFPLESSDVQNTKSDNLICILSSDDEDDKELNTPNLELALGSKWKTQAQQQNETVEDDDISASLSLSLAVPSPKEVSSKSIVKPEQHLQERPDVNTALLLFTAL